MLGGIQVKTGFMTQTEAARSLGVSRQRVWQKVQKGDFRVCECGKSIKLEARDEGREATGEAEEGATERDGSSRDRS